MDYLSDDDVPTSSQAKQGEKTQGAPSIRRDVKQMLSGFGDDYVPYEQTVDCLEAIVMEYIKELCQYTLRVGKPGKIQLEDIHYLIRRDAKKFARVKDLLSMSEELKRAKKQFEDVKAN